MESIPPIPQIFPTPPSVFVAPVRQSTKLSKEKKEVYKKAYKAEKEGLFTVYSAAKHYGICKTTLRNWCLRDSLDEDEIPAVGRPCFLGKSLGFRIRTSR